MAQSTTDSREDEWIGARVDPEFKRATKMRAADLDMTMSDYIQSLIREDLAQVEYADV
jgi:antitoxin component of RelBE/YafQ-DinJ toxin-antitoxin module